MTFEAVRFEEEEGEEQALAGTRAPLQVFGWFHHSTGRRVSSASVNVQTRPPSANLFCSSGFIRTEVSSRGLAPEGEAAHWVKVSWQGGVSSFCAP